MNDAVPIACDVHTHTVHSGHAFSTVNELANAAAEAGLNLIAITDHGPSMDGAAHAGYFDMVGRLPANISGVRLLMGIEANIITSDGGVDLDAEMLSTQQIVLAGLHERTPFACGSVIENTRAIRAAMESGTVHVITHPYRPSFPVDVEELARTAGDTGVCLEINVSLLRRAIRPDRSPARLEVLNQTRRMLDEMVRVGAFCTVASDAHHSSEVYEFPTNSREVIEALDVPVSMVVNRSQTTLFAHLKAIG
ncbi:PHP domain-containing protein [Bradyrhizobium sp. HKCCYLRH1062]|uniref:PHP domain-containing protein n=1 Tax=unclassified Bradyrhizobium TaxID=2631580 RepID=UPI003EB87450